MNYSNWIKVGAGLIVIYLIFDSLIDFSRSRETSDKIRFVSLAWQEQSIQANKGIVSEWNRANPDRKVEYIQGSWNSIYDYLITSFETDGVPDVFHYESSIIVDFANRGYLKDLAPLISNEMKKDIVDVAWSSVTSPNGEISGIPFVLESFIILYNKEIFDNNDIILPSIENPWTWNNVKIVGTQLTQDTNGDGIIDQWGTGMGLRNSANFILNHAISFGGSFFKIEDGKYVVRMGDEEKALLEIIIEMYRH
jgi:ABC-type glycerol-3-phosphate transport system substrate-binding protein